VAKSGASLITPQKPATAQGALSQKRTVLWKRVDDSADSPREPCVLKVAAAASAVPAATATARCSRSSSSSSVGDAPAAVEVVPPEAEAAGLLLHAAVSQANLQHAISEHKQQAAAVCELKPATVALAVAAQTALAAGVPAPAATAAAGGCDSPLLLCCAKEDDCSSADDNSPAGSMEPLDCSPVPADSTTTTAAAAESVAKPVLAAPKAQRWWMQDGVPLLSHRDAAVVVVPKHTADSEKCSPQPSSVYVSRAAAFENDTCAASAAAGSSGRSACTSPTVLQQQQHAQQQRAL
jgi:hypothetical protein